MYFDKVILVHHFILSSSPYHCCPLASFSITLFSSGQGTLGYYQSICILYFCYFYFSVSDILLFLCVFLIIKNALVFRADTFLELQYHFKDMFNKWTILENQCSVCSVFTFLHDNEKVYNYHFLIFLSNWLITRSYNVTQLFPSFSKTVYILYKN